MKIKVFVKKEAQIAGFLRQTHAAEIEPLLLQFLDFRLAKLLGDYWMHYGEDHKEYLLKILDGKIKVDYEIEWWSEVKDELEEFKKKFEEFYNKNIERALEVISEVFLISRFPKEVEVYLTYNLNPFWSFGTAVSYKDRCIIFQSAGKNEKRTIEDKFSGFLHELIHILFDYNNIELPNKFEEALLDYFVPGGLLDVKLGFISFDKAKEKIESIKERNKKRYEFYKEYFERLKILLDYDFSESVWEYLIEKSKDEEIKKICENVLNRITPK